MIEPLIGIGIFAALFAVFGSLKRRNCGGGSCGTCTGIACSSEERDGGT